jgi:hypothetical protein
MLLLSYGRKVGDLFFAELLVYIYIYIYIYILKSLASLQYSRVKNFNVEG